VAAFVVLSRNPWQRFVAVPARHRQKGRTAVVVLWQRDYEADLRRRRFPNSIEVYLYRQL